VDWGRGCESLQEIHWEGYVKPKAATHGDGVQADAVSLTFVASAK